MAKTIGVDIRYLAGFFDGEGCVLFHYLKASKFLRPEVEVAQTRLPILMEFKRRFGGTVVGPHQNNARSKPHWRWIALSNTCIKFLKRIEKYVTIKKPQVNLMLKYYTWKCENVHLYQLNKNGNGRQRTQETLKKLIQWRSQMQLLNKRGA